MLIVSSTLAIASAMLVGIVPLVIQIRLDCLNDPTLRPILKGRLELVIGSLAFKSHEAIDLPYFVDHQ